ncbi:MAG TPA: ATP-binding cassette domain-containing protein, partial [Actinomycetaceae bacterium]|nr:ATP-binding cassette domain-containing protein [Actinomycetaceae bacterium]
AAAEATFVDRFVRTLPEGYDTPIEEEGANISAGERQLITIARAFLADPALLILDEATSSVDTRTEVLVQEAMAALRTDRTSFVIAHRLSTIRDADVILVMEHGDIVELGDHDQLLAAGGAYHRLYWSQFMQGVDPDEEFAAVTGEMAAITGEMAAVTGQVPVVTGQVPVVTGAVPVTGELSTVPGQEAAASAEPPTLAAEPTRAGAAQDESARAEPTRAGAAQDESARAGATKDGPTRAGSTRAGAAQDEPTPSGPTQPRQGTEDPQ